MDKSTILIVDDEPVGRETLHDLLIGQGYNLAFAGDGQEALAKAAELAPDLILLDVMMPDMDGFEVCRRLRADPDSSTGLRTGLAQVPVIMVTALDDHESLLEGIEAGADDFISKPFNRAELRARVRTITRLNRYRRLLMERARFEWMVEQTDDGYLMLDDADRVLYANPQARLYLGLPAPETARFLELARKQYHPEPREAWATWPQRPPGDPPSPRYLVRPESPTANVFWLQVDLIEMASGGEERHFVRLRDVTSGIETRNNMWTFHAQVSHKLKTPLGLLIGFLKVLKSGLSTLSKAEIGSFLSTVHDSALRLHDAIMDIFQYVGATDMVHFGPPRCSLGEISPLVSEINANLGIKSINIAHEGLDNLNATFVPLSRHATKLILGELLENAVKFHPTGSPTLEIRISGVAGGIHVQVCDDGLTLSPDQLARIWTPYYQAEKYFTGQTPGMGLGLAVVASLVWNAGGTCRLYNREEGAGVIVELVLPLAETTGGANE